MRTYVTRGCCETKIVKQPCRPCRRRLGSNRRLLSHYEATFPNILEEAYTYGQKPFDKFFACVRDDLAHSDCCCILP